ncbi:sulfurtransferase [Nocardioides sp. WS12]|uniref:sulfurtransferase n=1 Tax=Nocardioides sp. WS12 TaxID=2486272 RepID=UPI0015F9E3D1|nr:sulfurtransferase [Nocardioides sp. WS12]
MARPLIDVADLADLVERGDPVTILDVRYRMGGPPGPEEFAAGHVPGASYVDLDTDLASPPGLRGRHPLPDSAAFEAAMRRVGVSNGRPVVVYDDWSAHAAARCWWLLRHHGHRDVRVLDGGWAAWTAAGLPVATGGEAEAAPGNFTAHTGDLTTVTAGNVQGVSIVIDARAPERYRGEVEPIDPVAGHIPGAVNVPTARNLGPDGRFLPAADLKATYAEVGAVAGADIAVYCGSGVTAAHDVLALEVAGVAAALYPGSWSEWVADPGRPVATSARP